jgi:hypothetical protein
VFSIMSFMLLIMQPGARRYHDRLTPRLRPSRETLPLLPTSLQVV